MPKKKEVKVVEEAAIEEEEIEEEELEKELTVGTINFIHNRFQNKFTTLVFIVQLEEYVFRDPLLFGDYRNALDEEEVRYYEDLLDYEAVYFLFQEVSSLRHISYTFTTLILLLLFRKYLSRFWTLCFIASPLFVGNN